MSIFESMLLNYTYPCRNWHQWLSGKASALDMPWTWVRLLASVKFFYLFRCVHSSVQPLQSVGMSNFDKGRHNLTTLIKKWTYINESCYIIYIYIYTIYVYVYIHNYNFNYFHQQKGLYAKCHELNQFC